MSNILKFKKLNEKAIIPKYQTMGSAGFDLHALVEREDDEEDFITILPGEQKIINTGLAAEIPDGWQMEIRARSGLAAKYSIAVTNGVGTIDQDYLFEIKVILFNLGKKVLTIKNGDRIAQGVMMPATQFSIEETNELKQTERKGGFGSTGI